MLRSPDHSLRTHGAGHGGGRAGRSVSVGDGARQAEEGRLLTPTVLCSTSSAREDPDLDGPGKDRQEHERVRVDSESLDDEDS